MNEMQNKVNALIERVERHQKALGLSDVRFVARYQRYLGSAKTWRDRLCARAWGELGNRLGAWEKKLEAFVSEIDGTSDASEFFENLPIAKYAQAVFDMLQGQRSDRRVSWLIAPTGCGKSWSMLRLSRENPVAAAYIHVHRGGRESLPILARMLARACGATEETGGAATYNNVVEALKANPMTLLVDDVHEGGVLLLKLVKHLVDDTRAKFILGTYPTAWRMLVNGSTDAHAEAQQLIGRSLKPVERRWEGGLGTDDAAGYLKAALGTTSEAKVLAEKIAPALRRHGNLRALADAVELARSNADEDGADVSAELIEAAVREICPAENQKR